MDATTTSETRSGGRQVDQLFSTSSSQALLNQELVERSPNLGFSSPPAPLESSRASTPEDSTAVYNTEYQEWPVDGVLQYAKIGDNIQCSIGFDFRQIHDILCSQGGLAERGARRRLPLARTENVSSATPRKKRLRYTEAEDRRLVELKGRGQSWEDIMRFFPERSMASVQVHYSTKLKDK